MNEHVAGGDRPRLARPFRQRQRGRLSCDRALAAASPESTAEAEGADGPPRPLLRRSGVTTCQSYRDLLTGATDVYLSTVSNRLNSVMKQLAVIATIFLPLAWLTGFFGQNFGWPVGQIGRWQTFVGVGIGTELTLLLLLAFFKRRGWF